MRKFALLLLLTSHSYAVHYSVTINLGFPHYSIQTFSVGQDWSDFGYTWGPLKDGSPYTITISDSSSFFTWVDAAKAEGSDWGQFPWSTVIDAGGGTITADQEGGLVFNPSSGGNLEVDTSQAPGDIFGDTFTVTDNFGTIIGTGTIDGSVYQFQLPEGSTGYNIETEGTLLTTNSTSVTNASIAPNTFDGQVLNQSSFNTFNGETVTIFNAETGEVLHTSTVQSDGSLSTAWNNAGDQVEVTYQIGDQVTGAGFVGAGSSVTVVNPYAGSTASIVDMTTGEVYAQGTVGLDGQLGELYAYYPSNTTVGYYLGTNFVGADSVLAGQNGGSFSPVVVGGGLELGVNPALSGYGSQDVVVDIIYQGTSSNSFGSGTVVWSGPADAVGTDIQVPFVQGGVYSVQAHVPQFEYQEVDGVGVWVPTNTNVVSYYTNVPLTDFGGSIFLSGAGDGVNVLNATSLPSPVADIPEQPGNIIVTNETVTDPGESVPSVQVSQAEFAVDDLGEQGLADDMSNALNSLDQVMDNLMTSYANFGKAVDTMAALRTPSASGGCSVTMGGYTLNLSAPPGIRAALGYLTWMACAVAVGMMLWDVTKS